MDSPLTPIAIQDNPGHSSVATITSSATTQQQPKSVSKDKQREKQPNKNQPVQQKRQPDKSQPTQQKQQPDKNQRTQQKNSPDTQLPGRPIIEGVKAEVFSRYFSVRTS